MYDDETFRTLKNVIDPEHLVRAIANSLEHSEETSHGVTGLRFKNYSIVVRKKPGLRWLIECKGLSPSERQKPPATDVNVGS